MVCTENMTVCRFILIVLLLMPLPLHAQGGAGMQNSYCAQFSDGSSPDCGFSSLQMCEQSVTGVGGVCIMNPSGPTSPLAPVPQMNMPGVSLALPPPVAQPSSGPLALPDASQAQPCNPLVDGTYCASAAANSASAAQAVASLGPMQSVSSDLSIGGDPPATLGAITFNGSGLSCIGLFRRTSC